MKNFPILHEFYKLFPTKEDCTHFIEKVRWRNRPTCPYCDSQRITPMKKEFRYHCNVCNVSFSVTVNTLFHNTKIPLQKWFAAIDIFLQGEKQISVRKLAEVINVNKNTAWTMLSKLKTARSDYTWLIAGILEPDKLFVNEGKR
jgi:transposase-like protein